MLKNYHLEEPKNKKILKMQENSHKISITANLHEIVKKVKFRPHHNLFKKIKQSRNVKQEKMTLYAKLQFSTVIFQINRIIILRMVAI